MKKTIFSNSLFSSKGSFTLSESKHESEGNHHGTIPNVRVPVSSACSTLVSCHLFNHVYHISLFTVRKQSCRRVMFSQACVKNSVHGGRCNTPSGLTGRHPLWQTPPGRHPPGQTTPLGGHPRWQTCRHRPRQTHLGQTPSQAKPPGKPPPPTPSHGHCSGRYASYWNAFLFQLRIPRIVSLFR